MAQNSHAPFPLSLLNWTERWRGTAWNDMLEPSLEPGCEIKEEKYGDVAKKLMRIR